jgi:hypothetical protein
VEEEDEVDSEEEDEFYDRTTTGPGKKQKVAPLVHDAASLFGRKVLPLNTYRHVSTPVCAGSVHVWKPGSNGLRYGVTCCMEGQVPWSSADCLGQILVTLRGTL